MLSVKNHWAVCGLRFGESLLIDFFDYLRRKDFVTDNFVHFHDGAYSHFLYRAGEWFGVHWLHLVLLPIWRKNIAGRRILVGFIRINFQRLSRRSNFLAPGRGSPIARHSLHKLIYPLLEELARPLVDQVVHPLLKVQEHFLFGVQKYQNLIFDLLHGLLNRELELSPELILRLFESFLELILHLSLNGSFDLLDH